MAKKALNKWTAPKSVAPEKIIQFGEGNFLRAFVDWIVWNMNAKTNFNGSVAVVQPIDKGMVEWLNGQDCLYHVNLQGRLDGKAVNSLERIDVISRALNPYTQNWAFMALAEQPEIRFVISNTTEAGIQYVKGENTFPAKVLRLLRARFAAKLPGLVFIPCELIEHNGDNLKAKVRLRWYGRREELGGEVRLFVEVKRRIGAARRKERLDTVVPAAWIADTPLDDPSFPAFLARQAERLGEPLGPAWSPVCRIVYDRLRYDDPLGGSRVALDWNIRADRFNESRFPWAVPVALDEMVCEFKNPGGIPPAWAEEMVRAGLRLRSFSKYGECMQRLSAGTP